MKILFLGDYSNLHGTLATYLRGHGHEVTLVSDGCRCMDLESDIRLARRRGLFSGYDYLYKIMNLMPRLAGYDVVQLINPHFFSLKPGKLIYFFKELARQNGSMFLSLAGNDHFFVRQCVLGEMFRFSEFRVGKELTPLVQRNPNHEAGYLLPSVRNFSQDLYGRLDGAMAVLPEYDMAARPELGDRLVFTNLPVDLAELQPLPFSLDGKVRILVGMRSENIDSKGTSVLLEAAKIAEKRLPDRVEAMNVRDLPWRQYKEALGTAHVVLDQLYSYSPGMNGLSTMALGRVAGTGAQPEYYEYLEEKTRPIFELSPQSAEEIAARLCDLVTDPDRLKSMAAEGRRLVERHNDVAVVAKRYLDHWENTLNRK